MISQQGYDFLYGFAWGAVVESYGHSEIPTGIEQKIAVQSKIATLSGKKPGNLLELAGLTDLVTINGNPTKSAYDSDSDASDSALTTIDTTATEAQT